MSFDTTDTGAPGVRETEPQTSDRRESLAVERRHRLLEALSERTPPVALSTAAESLARGTERDSPAIETRDRLETALHHTHLPKLDDVGVVDYDPESRLIYPTEASSRPVETGPPAAGSPVRGPSPLYGDLRRTVVEYFDETAAETATLSDVAGYATARQDVSDGRTVRELRLRLHHTTLPKLATEGIVDYDHRTNSLRYRGDTPSNR